MRLNTRALVYSKPVEAEEEKQFVRRLAYQWSLLELPSSLITYSDYINTIARLQYATDDVVRTEYIFTVVINQARQLGKSSEWVAHELQFESNAESFSDRVHLMLLEVNKQPNINDATLDLYNERLNRFN